MLNLTIPQITEAINDRTFTRSQGEMMIHTALMALTSKEVKVLVSEGIVTHGQANAVMEKLEVREYKNAQLASITGLTAAQALPYIPAAFSEYRGKFSKEEIVAVTLGVLDNGERLDVEDCEALSAELEMDSNTIGFVSQHAAKLAFPNKYPGRIARDNSGWTYEIILNTINVYTGVTA